MSNSQINMVLNRTDIIEATKGTDLNDVFVSCKNKVTGVSIDSRTIKKGELFIALKGRSFDGHVFIENAIKKGASGIIVSDKILAKKYGGLFVKNTKNSLINLAKFSRKRFKGTVIAITGSNGKTSTKNILASLLKIFGKTHSTYKNNNNILGLALTLSNLKINNKFCVLELGMNNKTELAKLSTLSSPNIVAITNVSSSHIGNFENEKAIAKAKSEIFEGLIDPSLVILNSDDKWFNYLKEQAKVFSKEIFYFGKKPDSIVKIKQLITKGQGTFLEINNNIKLDLKNLPLHQTLNVCCALSVIRVLKLAEKKVFSKIYELKPDKGRGNYLKISLDNNNYFEIINDAYNANPVSMIAALKNIYETSLNNRDKNIVLIIGDMLELGKNSRKFHLSLVPKIIKINPRLLITVGKDTKTIFNKLKNKINCTAFQTVKDLKIHFFDLIKPKDIVLIKGSNGVGLFDFCSQIEKPINS